MQSFYTGRYFYISISSSSTESSREASRPHYIMSEFTFSTVIAFLGLALLGYFFGFKQKHPPKSLRFVPGPKGLPLVGNTLSLGSQP